MASPRPGHWTEQQWREEGERALLDLLSQRLVVPWHEAEARITQGWKQFRHVQPVQLHGSRIALEQRGLMVSETSGFGVTTVRLPITAGNKRRIERVRGEKRQEYRRYLSWTNNQYLCGKHAEATVLSSLEASASKAGLYVPQQTVGDIREISGVSLQGKTLDAHASIFSLPEIQNDAWLASW